MKLQDILYVFAIGALVALAFIQAANANTRTFTGYDQNANTNYDLTIERRYGKIQGQLYNYATGGSIDVELKPKRIGGGLQGQGYNFGSGQYFDVEVDRFGNVEVYGY